MGGWSADHAERPVLARGVVVTSDYVGTAALGCPVEHRSTDFIVSKNKRSVASPDSRGRLSPRGS